MEIWVVGDTRFMYEVFNAVAMITATNDWLALIRVGFMLGMLLIAFRALMNQKLELHHLMISFIIYGCMFVPKTTAVLIDAFNPANIRAVDNVPVGVVFTASLLSKIGKGMTDLNEQAFQPIDPSQTSYEGLMAQGYLDPLKDLLKLRETMYGSTEPDLDYNLKEYYSNCTARNLQNKTLTAQQLMNAPDVWQAARAPSPILTTTWSTGGAISERTCFDADADLNAALTNPSHQTVLSRAVASVIGEKDPTQVISDLQGPFQSIAGAGAQAYTYMFNVIQMQYLVSGADMATARSGDMTYAYIVQSARERRDLNHAVEKTLFEDIMRPIMTFFEALIYSVSPLMVFLFVMGPVAVKFVSKYILLAAWVQLWLPMFAIIKLFTYLALNGDMDSMQSNGLVMHSLEWAWAFQQNLSRWIGISGWLSAATPTISLALVYGGAVTANSIASRMQSVSREAAAQAANTFSPGLLTVGPSGVQIGDQNLQPQMTPSGFAFVRGMTGVQTPSGGAFEYSMQNNSALRQAHGHLESVTGSASGQLLTQYARSADFTNMVRSATGGSLAHQSQSSTQAGGMYSRADSWNIGDKYQLSESERSAISVLGGMGLSAVGFRAGASAISESSLARQGVTDADQRKQLGLQMTDQIMDSYNQTRDLRQSFESGKVMNDALRYSKTENSGISQEVANRYQSADEASRGITAAAQSGSRIEWGNLERTAALLSDPGLPHAAALKSHLMKMIGGSDFDGALSFIGRLQAVDPSQHWDNLAANVREGQAAYNDFKDHLSMLPATSKEMMAQLNADGPPLTPTLPGAEKFRGEVGTGIEAGRTAARENQGVMRTPEQLKAEQEEARLDPGRTQRLREDYAGDATQSVDQLRASFATHPAQDAGETAEQFRQAIDKVFPSNGQIVRDTVAAHQAQWRGVGMQVAGYAHSLNPDENVSTGKVDFESARQQMDLGRDPAKAAQVFGAGNAEQISADGKRVDDLTRAYMKGDEDAEGQLRAEFVRMTGSEEGADKAMGMLARTANQTVEDQEVGQRAMYMTEVAPAAGIFAGNDAQRSTEARKLIQLTAEASDTNYLPDNTDRPGDPSLHDFTPSDLRGMVTSDRGGMLKGTDFDGASAEKQIDDGVSLIRAAVLNDGSVLTGNSGSEYLAQVQRRLGALGGPDANAFGGTPDSAENLDKPGGLTTRSFPAEAPAPEAPNSGLLLGSIPSDGVAPQALEKPTKAAGDYASRLDALATTAAAETAAEAPNSMPLRGAGSGAVNTAPKLEGMQKADDRAALNFRSELLGLEAERTQGAPRDEQIRNLFDENFQGTSGTSMYNAYVAARSGLEERFRTEGSTEILTGMQRDNSLSEEGFHPFRSVPGGGNVSDPQEARERLRSANTEGSDIRSDLGPEKLEELYLGRVKATQDATAEDLRSRASIR